MVDRRNDKIDPYTGEKSNTPDTRENKGRYQNAYVFNTQYKDEEKVVEILVNPEFTESEALIKAKFYGEAIGRLPFDMRKDL